VSRELARRVGERGSVVAIDLDATVLELARADAAAAGITNVDFRCGDATRLEGSYYDVADARFLPSHLRDPARIVATMAAALRPDGVVIVEDTLAVCGQWGNSVTARRKSA
jgi:ubiquinone/menaquinone biosynthesis C-methylase UbiE